MQMDLMMSLITYVIVSCSVAAETDFNRSDGSEDVFACMSEMADRCARIILVILTISMRYVDKSCCR